MSLARASSPFVPGGANRPLPRGSLEIGEAREIILSRSSRGGWEASGKIATDTRGTVGGAGFLMPVPMPDAPPEQDLERICDAEVAWGGNLVAHYGHFLTESVSRLWALLPGAALNGMGAVFTTPQEEPFIREWFDAFGIATIDLPRKGTVRFKRMYVPEAAWQLENWIAPEIRDIHLQARRGMGIPTPARRDVVWLSKSGLRKDKPFDESLLEWLLDDRVDRVRPERMALADQVAALEGARAVAGVIGSAFHTLLMVENVPDSLYLCPPWDRGAFPAQHRFLDGKADFRPALERLASTRALRNPPALSFPGCFRLLIPEALRALSETVLPGLLDDPRLASFADPGAARPERAETELDAAALRALREPLAPEPRRRLAELFEAAGLERCAEEQRELVRTLVGAAPGG